MLRQRPHLVRREKAVSLEYNRAPQKKRAETVQKLSPLWSDRHSATKVVIMTERFYEWRGKLPETHNTLSQQTEDHSNDF